MSDNPSVSNITDHNPSDKQTDKEDLNTGMDLCGDDDCVIIKVVERAPSFKKYGCNKLQPNNIETALRKSHGVNNESGRIKHNNNALARRPTHIQDQLRRNPKRLAKQLNNRKRRLESRYDFSYVPTYGILSKKRKILRSAKENLANIESSNYKVVFENKEDYRDCRTQLPCNKQANEKTANNMEDHTSNKARTRSKCTEASEFAPPSPERLMEWRDWPAEGMHERPIYRESLEEKRLQESAHHALHAVLAFCVMVCNQKSVLGNCEGAEPQTDYKKVPFSSKLFYEIKDSNCDSCKHKRNSDNELLQVKRILSSYHVKIHQTVTNQKHVQSVSKLMRKDNSKDLSDVKCNLSNKVKDHPDRNTHNITEIDSILNSSNSSTVSGGSGDLIIAENEDESEQDYLNTLASEENSLPCKKNNISDYPSGQFLSVNTQQHDLLSSDTNWKERQEPKKSQAELGDQCCKCQVSAERQLIKKHTENILTKRVDDCVTLEGLQDLINYTALLYCVVCSVPQSALADYINSLTPSSILEWLTEVSQNVQVE